MNFPDWQHMVLQSEGLADWKIRSGEAYCWLNSKTIMLDREDHSLFLHEVAHALSPRPEPIGNGLHFHGGHWADAFTRLVRKYLTAKADCLEALEPFCRIEDRGHYSLGQICGADINRARALIETF